MDKTRLIKNESLKEKIYNELKEMVIMNELESGSRIVINNMREMFGVSSTPVRDALHYLHADGLIEIVNNNNYVIDLSSDDVEEIYEMRELLEPFAIDCIIKNNLEESYSKLAELYQKVQNCNPEDVFNVDMQFHDFILERCSNQRLKKQLRILLNQSYHIAYKMYHKINVQEKSQEDIDTIIEAMINKDSDLAQSLLRKHLYNSKVRIEKEIFNVE